MRQNSLARPGWQEVGLQHEEFTGQTRAQRFLYRFLPEELRLSPEWSAREGQEAAAARGEDAPNTGH